MPDNFNDIELNLAVKAFLNDETLMEDIKRLKESMNSEVNTLSFKAKVSDKNIKQLTEQLIEGSEKALADNPVDIKVHYSEMEEGFKELKKLKDNLQKQLQKEYDNFLSNKTSYIDYEKMGDTKLAEQYRKKTGLNAVKIEQLGKQLLDIGNILNKVNIEVPNLNLGSIKFNFDKIGESINNINNFLQAVLNQLSMEKFEIEDMIVQENKDIIKAKKSKAQNLKNAENNSSKDNTTDKESKKGSKDELAQKYYLDSINRLSKRYEEQQKKLRDKEYNWKNSEQALSDLKDYYETTKLLKLLMDKTGIKSVKKDIENNIPKIDNDKLSRNRRDIIDRASKNNISEKKINEIENDVSKVFEDNEKVIQLINKVIGIQDKTTNSIINDLSKYASDTSQQSNFSQEENINSKNINKKIKALSIMLADYEDFYNTINGINEDDNELSKNEKLLQESGQEIIELYTAIQKYINNVSNVPPLDSNIIDQIENVNNDLLTLNQKQSSTSNNNTKNNDEVIIKNKKSTASNNYNETTNINNVVLSEDIFNQIQEKLNKFSFTIYISRALLSEDFKSDELQRELDNVLTTNPIKVNVATNIIQNNNDDIPAQNNLSVNISEINLSNEEVIKDIKSRIETALSPIVINNIEINQENIDNIKEQIKNALYTFTIDKIEFNPEIDIDKISNQINNMLSSIQMPTLDYSSNAKALKAELENALAQVSMPNGSLSSLVPDNTANDLDTINKMSSALENLKRAINNINRSITRISQNIEDRNSGIISNMEADMSKLQSLIDQVEKLKQTIDSIGNIKNIVVTIQNRSNSSSSDKNSGNSNNQNTNTSTTSSNNFNDYYNNINNKIAELNKAIDNKEIRATPNDLI